MNTALVVGAGGGMGAATTRALAALGWRVFAAGRTLERLQPLAALPGVTAVPLDVTDPDAVAAARSVVASEVGALDALVYSAGVLGVGSLAQMPVARLEHILATNTVGAARVVQEFLPLVRATPGRIVIVSSELARRSGHVFTGPYGMSKHALDVYADSLRRELGLVGVRVVKVQPGPIRTAMVDDLADTFESAAAESPLFGAHLRRVGRLATGAAGTARHPDLVARAVVHALTTARPRATYPVNLDLGRALLDLLPTAVADAVVRRVVTWGVRTPPR